MLLSGSGGAGAVLLDDNGAVPMDEGEEVVYNEQNNVELMNVPIETEEDRIAREEQRIASEREREVKDAAKVHIGCFGFVFYMFLE
jgi:hypothetical protein